MPEGVPRYNLQHMCGGRGPAHLHDGGHDAEGVDEDERGAVAAVVHQPVHEGQPHRASGDDHRRQDSGVQRIPATLRPQLQPGQTYAGLQA